MNEQALIASQPNVDDTSPLGNDATGVVIGFSLLVVVAGLFKQRRLIVSITAIATVIGVAISLTLPLRFTATTRLLTPQPTQSAMGLMMSQPMNSSAVSLLNATSGGFALRNPNDLYIG